MSEEDEFAPTKDYVDLIRAVELYQLMDAAKLSNRSERLARWIESKIKEVYPVETNH